MDTQNRKSPQQISLLKTDNNGVSDFHRDSRSGMAVALAPNHVSDATPALQEELANSQAYRTTHTIRIMRCLQTQIISFFKGPGRNIDLDSPDKSKVIDLGSLQILEKHQDVGEWSDLGWAYRWSTEAIRMQLGYTENHARTIKLNREVFNLLVKVPHVWIPKKTEENSRRYPARMNLFFNVNTPETVPTLDAGYFNINNGWIKDILNSEEATVIFSKKILSELRSPVAQVIANYLIVNLDLNNPTEIKQTAIEDQQGYVNMFYPGKKKLHDEDKSNRLAWRDFVRDHIAPHIKVVKKAFGFKEFRFSNNRKRGPSMLCWFEYNWQSEHPLEAAYENNVPALSLPELVSPGDVKPLKTAVIVKKKFTWEEVIELTPFIQSISETLTTMELPHDALSDVIRTYSSRALAQTPKSVKQWLVPFRKWLMNRKEQFSSAVDRDDIIDFLAKPESITETRNTTTVDKRAVGVRKVSKKIPPVKRVAFSENLVTDQVVLEISVIAKEVCPNFEQYTGDLLDFIKWNTPKFKAYHMAKNGSDYVQTVKQWQSYFKGFVKNALNMPQVRKEYRSMKFEPWMIIEESPFQEVIAKQDKTTRLLMNQSLAIFQLTFSEDEMGFAQWQKKAWDWLRNENALKIRRVTLPALIL